MDLKRRLHGKSSRSTKQSWLSPFVVLALFTGTLHSNFVSWSAAETSEAHIRRRVSLHALAPGRYRALTKIRVRKAPDVNSDPTGAVVQAGEEFEVVEVVQSGPEALGFLRLSDADGWIFDKGLAGRWINKEIVEPVSSHPATPKAAHTAAAPVQSTAPAVVVEASPIASATQETQKVVAAKEVKPLETVVALATAGIETVRLPPNMLGAGFEFVRLEVEGARQPLTFMLGTAFPANALTTRGQSLVDSSSSQYKGGWLSKAASTVDLKGVKFLGTGSSVGNLEGFTVLDFPQAQLSEQLGIEVHGILGQPFFAKYDFDLNRFKGRADLYSPGGASSQGFYSTVKHLPGISLPSGVVGLAVTGSLANEEPSETPGSFVGIIDSSASHTVINWEAAKVLGFSGRSDPRLLAATKVLGAGLNGQAEEMPVILLRLSLCSAPEGVKPMLLSVDKDRWEAKGGKGWYFSDLNGGSQCIKFGAVNVAVGDVLGLSVLDDSKIGPFKGAAAIIGQDILFQADRVVLDMKDSQVWIEPGDVRDAPEM